jgi:hypothetical protein
MMCSVGLTGSSSAAMLDLNVLGGVKQLSHTDWGSHDSQGTVGVEAAVSPPVIPFSVVAGYLHSQDSSDDKTQEVWVGPGMKLDLPLLHFLLSGGATFIRAEQGQASTINTPVSTASDNGWGYYASGSAFFKVFGFLNLGAQVRYSAAKVDLAGRDMKAGGISYLGLVGVGF